MLFNDHTSSDVSPLQATDASWEVRMIVDEPACNSVLDGRNMTANIVKLIQIIDICTQHLRRGIQLNITSTQPKLGGG